MNIEITGIKCRSIIDAVGKIFVAGDDETLKKILCGIISGGHILFEDNPGLGKTLLVKVFAGVLGCNWKRIQFTPDILPSDIVGTKVWKGTSSEFELEKGPVFTNILLADEINRAMPKTQSALLESMEEKQVTIEGETHSLGPPFIVMATQNPI
ncbi:MAG TPA: AAA family ATPase, partial [Clostridia bacterium]